VVGRYARTHGPFTAPQAALDLGLPLAVIESELGRLEQAGRATPGAFRLGQGEREWIDTEVLRRLKRRSLAALRRDVEPVDQASLARFAPAWQRVTDAPPRGIAAMVETIRRLQGAELPASVLERDVLAGRVAEPAPMLDRLLSEGEVVWAGRGGIGRRDGRIALYLRDQLPLLWHPPSGERPAEDLHDRLREHLEGRGASFFRDLYQAAGGGDPGTVLDALWDLVWAGEVTNDTFSPVRALLAGTRPAMRGTPLASSFPASASGRWALLSHLLTVVEPTRMASAWTSVLLDRHGLVTRSTVLAEGLPGGFAGIYPVLSQMEERGRVRRGYFVEGLGGAQFAMPGAVDSLRNREPTGSVVLASTDPANPYGAALPWPETGARLARDAGSYVFMVEGRLAAFLDRGGRNLSLLDPDVDRLSDLARGLATVASRHRRFRIETVDGGAIEQTRLAPVLSEWGFVPALKGLRLKS
jgi:ATP-dependent Lhr-like helicase